MSEQNGRIQTNPVLVARLRQRISAILLLICTILLLGLLPSLVFSAEQPTPIPPSPQLAAPSDVSDDFLLNWADYESVFKGGTLSCDAPNPDFPFFTLPNVASSGITVTLRADPRQPRCLNADAFDWQEPYFGTKSNLRYWPTGSTSQGPHTVNIAFSEDVAIGRLAAYGRYDGPGLSMAGVIELYDNVLPDGTCTGNKLTPQSFTSPVVGIEDYTTRLAETFPVTMSNTILINDSSDAGEANAAYGSYTEDLETTHPEFGYDTIDFDGLFVTGSSGSGNQRSIVMIDYDGSPARCVQWHAFRYDANTPGDGLINDSITSSYFGPILFDTITETEIGNRVWIESDSDGLASTGTILPVIDATVTAVGPSNRIYTTTTDANGYYTLTVPADTTYTVTVPTPVGYTRSTVLHTTDSDPASNDNENHDSTGTTVSITTTNNTTIDFAFTLQDNFCQNNLFTNASFESGTHSGGSAFAGGLQLSLPSAPGGNTPIAWNQDTGNGDMTWIDSTKAFSGTKYLYTYSSGTTALQNDACLAPDNTVTGIQSNTQYELCAWVADANADGFGSGLALEVQELNSGGGNSTPFHHADVLIPDNPAWSDTAATDIPWSWQCHTFTTAATTTQANIWVSASAEVGGSTSYLAIDDVCLQPVETKIGDTVWYDADMDGTQNETNEGIEGVIVYLYDLAGTVVATDTTSATGYYEFTSADGVLAGTDYHIIVPSDDPVLVAGGYSLTMPNQGSDDEADSDADQVGNGASVLSNDVPGASNFDAAIAVTAPNREDLSYDFGYVRAWSYSCTDPQSVDTYPIGLETDANWDTNGSHTTNIPTPGNVERVIVEAVFRTHNDTCVPNEVTFTGSTGISQTVTGGKLVEVRAFDNDPAEYNMTVFRTQLAGNQSSVTLSAPDGTCDPLSYVVYAIRSDGGENKLDSGFFPDRFVGVEIPTDSATFPLISSTEVTDYTFDVLVVDGATTGSISIDAGGVNDSTAWTYGTSTDYGTDVIGFSRTLSNVPANTSSASVTIGSISSSSWGIPSAIRSSAVCAVDNKINLGNFVWYDADNSGEVDGNELTYGLSDVVVELYDLTNTLVATDTTANGYYLFENLDDGDYYVRVPASNFGAGQPLSGYSSSDFATTDPDDDTDNDDDGQGNSTGVDVDSLAISLTIGTEPVTTTVAGDTNLSVDFGFTAPICAGANDLGGQIFRDYDNDGVNDLVSGADGRYYDGSNPVTVFAYDAANSLVATTTLRPDGTYLFDDIFIAQSSVRVEFTGLPSYLDIGLSGPDNGTETQFHSAGTCSADLGVVNPADYCDSDPMLGTSCFINGDQSFPTDAIVAINYNDRAGTPAHIALAPQVGATWGMAYQASSNTIFNGAFLKRHVGLGPDGLDAIYVIDYSAPGPNGAGTLLPSIELFDDLGVDVGTDPRVTPLPASPTDPSHDVEAFAQIGRIGIGDIEMSEDGNTLYVINANLRELVALDVTDLNSVSVLSQTAIPDPGCMDSANGVPAPQDRRPWAISVQDGEVYVGVTCSAETSQLTTDLHAYVMRLDGGSFVSIFDVALDHSRGCNLFMGGGTPTNGGTCYLADWQPWQSTWNFPPNPFGFVIFPQPLLSDIEFDTDGSLLLGFTDILGHQAGYGNYSADISDTTADSYGVISGDLVRACYAGSGYILEGDPGCSQNFFGDRNYGFGSGNGGEFFDDGIAVDIGGGTINGHDETAMGSLALLKGSGEVVNTNMDPLAFDSGGWTWYDTQSGNQTGDTQLYTGLNSTNGTSGKAAGLGDTELFCQSAPLEIGNYIWLDADGDGIQDPSEVGINGVVVQLWLDPDGTPGNGDESLVSTTTTDATGEYYFRAQPTTNYYISVNPNDSMLDGLSITTKDYASNANHPDTGISSDVHDSDGMLDGNTSTIIATLTTGNAGDNDYTYDFGFTPLGAVGNYVWVDENSDGYQDAGEPGIPNVTVILRDSGGTEVARTVTDGNGGYLFPDLPFGSYFVDVDETTIPTGMTQTPPSTLPNADFGNQDHSGNGYAVTIGNGQPVENLTADFGYNYNPDTDVNGGTNNATLGDRIWIDVDGDGAQDPNEVGVSGVQLTLYHDPDEDGVYDTPYTVGGYTPTTTTDANGNYIFDDLPAGSYVVTVTDDAGASHDILNTGDYTQTGDPDHFGTTGTNNDNTTTTPIILAPGDVFLNVDFGYQPQPPGSKPPHFGSIGDTIFYDADADGNGMSQAPVDGGAAVTQGAGGSADPTDYGIAGVTVSLIQDTNGNGVWDTGEPIIATDTTDENGQYLFDGLAFDDYIVWVNDTDNVLDSLTQTYDSDGVLASPDQSAVTITPVTANNRLQDFGYSDSAPQGSIGDTVWFDVDNSGGDQTTQGAEPGIADVTVRLYADADGDGTPDDVNGDGSVDATDAIATTPTDSNGNYLFNGLPLDSYVVGVDTTTLPAGFNTTSIYESDGDNDDLGASVTLTGAQPANRDQDFSYTLTDQTLGSIGDTIFGDMDGTETDGVPDAGDVPLAGVTVNLTDSSGNTQTTVTDENGNYLFDSLPTGVYTVTVDTATLPEGFSTISTYDGSDNGGTPQGNSSSTITLGSGEDNRDQDFSYPPNDASYTIGDTVWFDVNNSGGDQTTQGSEPGLAGVRVNLYDSGNTLIDSVVTDENGAYLFTGLGTDTYTVEVETGSLPPYVGTTSTHDGSDDGGTPDGDSRSTVTVNAGNPHGRAEDFSYPPAIALGAIGDTVWFDVDGSGGATQGDEPGIEGVIVVLTDENGNTRTTTTDENGHYYFGDLPLGVTYTVTVPAENFASGGVLEGMSNTYDPDDDDDNAGVGVTLTSATPVDLNQDFSYVGTTPYNLGNLVWLDQNADGNWDGVDGPDGTASTDDDETIITGVTIDLYRDLNGNDQVDAGEPLIGSATTTASVTTTGGDDGNYLFTGLPNGDYVVDVTDENGVLAGYWHSLGTANTTDNSQVDPYALTITDGDNLSADFGYYVEPAAVGNYVWVDTNNNGLQDDGETGLNDVEVQLVIAYPDGTNVTLVTQTITDTSGNAGYYSFGNLLLDEDYNDAGGAGEPTYTISVDVNQTTLSDYSAGQVDVAGGTNDRDDSDDHSGVAAAPVQGLVDTNSADPTTDEPAIASYDFAVVEGVQIGNRIWYEADGDGDGTNGSPTAASGLTVTVTASDGTTITAVTDGSGFYTVTVPANATYTVTVDTPAGYTPSTVLVSGTDSTPGDNNDQNHDSGGAVVTVSTADNLDIDFAFTPISTYSIGNLVWIDAEDPGDGTYTQADGDILPTGITVNLYRVTGGIPEATPFMTTTTNSGAYQFSQLPAGEYQVGIPSSMFQTGGPLADHGVVVNNYEGSDDTDDSGDHNTVYVADAVANGVRSNTVTVGDGLSEPLLEPAHGLTTVDPDERSDWTVDFAFAPLDATAVSLTSSVGTATAARPLLIVVAMIGLLSGYVVLKKPSFPTASPKGSEGIGTTSNQRCKK